MTYLFSSICESWVGVLVIFCFFRYNFGYILIIHQVQIASGGLIIRPLLPWAEEPLQLKKVFHGEKDSDSHVDMTTMESQRAYV